MSNVSIQPIRPRFKMEMLTSDELKQIKGATLQILQEVGVHFPSDRALGIFVAHGAVVDDVNQIVRIPEDLVLEAMGNAPRSYTLSGRSPGTNLFLDGSQSYFCTDGCGVHTQDFETGEIRPSNKEDVAKMARVADYLSSIAFYWPIVSAQNFGTLTPLHELDASFNHTVKHVQTETLLGETQARQAVKTAEYINTIPEKYLCHGSSVQIAHDWGVPILGGAFGVDTEEQASWQLGRDSVYTALLTPLTGADIVVGLGLLKGSRVLVPEQIILDDEIYHTNRVIAEGIELNDDTLALDVISKVGPRGNFLSQKHTRRHLREI